MSAFPIQGLTPWFVITDELAGPASWTPSSMAECYFEDRRPPHNADVRTLLQLVDAEVIEELRRDEVEQLRGEVAHLRSELGNIKQYLIEGAANRRGGEHIRAVFADLLDRVDPSAESSLSDEELSLLLSED